MFKGEILEGSPEQFESIKFGIKEVYKDEIFDVDLQDGSYFTMNNNLIQQSIFRVVKQ